MSQERGPELLAYRLRLHADHFGATSTCTRFPGAFETSFRKQHPLVIWSRSGVCDRSGQSQYDSRHIGEGSRHLHFSGAKSLPASIRMLQPYQYGVNGVTVPNRESSRWLLLIHQIPPKPEYLRVKIWRRMQRIGAVAVKNSVYVLPKNEEALEDFQC